MISLPFETFKAGEYSDNIQAPFTLYMVFNGPKCLYIGITTNNPFNRWFNNGHSHCLINIYGELQGQSKIGRMVAESMPESNKWEVQLWTTKDCIEWLVLNRPEKYKRLKEADIHSLEPIIIQEFKPSKNVIFNTQIGDRSIVHPPMEFSTHNEKPPLTCGVANKRISSAKHKAFKVKKKETVILRLKPINRAFLSKTDDGMSEFVDKLIDIARKDVNFA